MRQARGFSLLELLVVIVLIAATTAMAAVAMRSGLPGQQLRNSTRELAAQIRYTRAQAIVTGKPQVFTLDTRTREWLAPDRRHGQVPAAIAIHATAAGIEQPSAGIAAIRFFPEGASTGGRITLSREHAAWQLDVDWLTGQVSMTRAEAPP
ncbi:type II secretion system protein XpsH [Arenimonas oryziterrae]|uniref:Type II secretion system protein H n=1 Tax=Arenimonas oryziterrae DSM 21050 = YC6267 TaxID=1121015 RepID=A0A091BFM8_9GAMM|nr:GspH/FimT family protein [Arenimonas oryziterrae]KFN43190.1 hypothetical protein N789_11550 [Arenimonas oryziterrae DSM 21050 = YC6267]